MKRIATYLAGVSLLTLAASSCTKESHSEMRQQPATSQIIKASVSPGQTYVLNLGSTSATSIQTQAQHAQHSAIVTAGNGSTSYQYISQKGFAGADEVTLQQTTTQTTSSGGGCGQGYNNSGTRTTTSVSTIVVKLTVAN